MSFDVTLPSRSARDFDVVGYGENSFDFVAVLAAFPEPDAKGDLLAFEMHPGGQVATAVLAAARLGCRPRYVGVFGDDRWGIEIRAALVAGGVQVVGIERPGVSTRTAVVLVDAQRRRTVLERRDPRLALNAGEVDGAVFQSGRILMLDATDVPGAIRAATAARAAGTRVIVDVDRPCDGLDDLLRLADVVISSDAYRGSPEAGQVWITTLGAEGSVAREGNREIRTAGWPVTVRDTTGAGDVFRGAFAARWAVGGDVTLEALLAYANAAGALACRSVGAQGSLPTPDEVSQLLAQAAGRGKSL